MIAVLCSSCSMNSIDVFEIFLPIAVQGQELLGKIRSYITMSRNELTYDGLQQSSGEEASNECTRVVTKSAPNVAHNPGAREVVAFTGSSTTLTIDPEISSRPTRRDETIAVERKNEASPSWIDAHVNISQHVTAVNWVSDARRVPASSLFLTIMILLSTSPGPRFYVNLESYD